MPTMTVGTSRALILGHYHEKVLAMQPIAFWPQWEVTGSTIHCLTNPAMNGTYTGVSLADDLGPFGWKAPFYDGANDYGNIYSLALSAAFNGNEGSLATWCKVANVGVWTDGLWTNRVRLETNANNKIEFGKSGAANTLYNTYLAAAGGSINSYVVPAPTVWFHTVITWSKAANEVIEYYNGVNVASGIQAGNNWAGALGATTTVIGASTTVPNGVWHGWLSAVALWDWALPPGAVEALAQT